MSRLQVEGSSLTAYTAAEAAIAIREKRLTIDAACLSGALFAVDRTPDSSRRSWVILEADLVAWHHAGRPINPPKSTAV
jgi:hypothetical protein